MAYQMGQLRYSGSETTENSVSLGYYTAPTTESETTGFKDVFITVDLVKGNSYFLSIPIPQDLNYDMTFAVKLFNTDTKSYQYLKSFTVNSGSTISNAKFVVLYEDLAGETKVAFPTDYHSTDAGDMSKIYVDKTGATNKYYLYNGSSYEATDRVNGVNLNKSWLESSSTSFVTLEALFTPVDDSFSGILLEMSRIPEDYSIASGTDYGRVVDITKIRSKVGVANVNKIVRSVTDLVSARTGVSSLSRIGVWGRPGLPLSVNGEEIHIGPSGYYEQDVVPVTSFGVVSTSINDNWTMDYMYNVDQNGSSEGETE
jgi:hypothetical protein